jgi:hypothetical protein
VGLFFTELNLKRIDDQMIFNLTEVHLVGGICNMAKAKMNGLSFIRQPRITETKQMLSHVKARLLTSFRTAANSIYCPPALQSAPGPSERYPAR